MAQVQCGLCQAAGHRATECPLAAMALERPEATGDRHRPCCDMTTRTTVLRASVTSAWGTGRPGRAFPNSSVATPPPLPSSKWLRDWKTENCQLTLYLFMPWHAGTVAWQAAPTAVPPPPPPRWLHATAPELRRLLAALRALGDAGAAAAPAALGNLMSPAGLLALGVITDELLRAQLAAAGGGNEGFRPRVYDGATQPGEGDALGAELAAAGGGRESSGPRVAGGAAQPKGMLGASGEGVQGLDAGTARL